MMACLPLAARMLLPLLWFAGGLAAAQPAAPLPEPARARAQNLAVFVDPPTGFVFVKLPAGWKFVGTVDRSAMRALPPHVLTSLLRGGPASGRAARAVQPRRRAAAAARAHPSMAAYPSSADTLADGQPATF